MRSWQNDLTARLKPLRLRPEREAEIIEELGQHLDDEVRDLILSGAEPDDARRSALAELDAPGELALRLRAIERRAQLMLPTPGAPARGRWIRAIWQDTRYALFALRRTPAFSLAVIVTLALIIGPTTAILSIGNWLIWRPAPLVSDPDRLAVVLFGEWRDNGAVSPRRISDLNLADLQQASRTIATIGGWQELAVSVAADGVAPRRVESAHADVNFLPLLGVRPIAGRAFNADDNRWPFGSPVALISLTLAEQLYGQAASAVGRTLTVNSRRLTIVGVLPRGFTGASPFSRVDIWVPARTNSYIRHFPEETIRSRAGRGTSGVFYTFVIRLRPGATFEAVQAELDVLVPALATQYPDENGVLRAVRARVFPGLGTDELQRDRYATLVRNLLIVGGLLLLLGCANVTNLLISRGVRQQHERAVRVALGATRARLAQLLLTESAVLAVLGAALGVVLAVWLKQVIQTLLLPQVALTGDAFDVPIDGRVLAGTLGISLACGLAAGVLPAWVGTRSLGGAIGRGQLRMSQGGVRLRTSLAVVQLALSLALVTNATLLVVTLVKLTAIDVGFDPGGLVVHYVDLRSHGYSPDRAMVYNRELLARLSVDPIFESVSLSHYHPPRPATGADVVHPRGGPEERVAVMQELVTRSYFQTLGLPIVRGRTFTEAEALDTPEESDAPAILSDALARRLFDDIDVLGRHVRVPGRRPRTLTVVGVAGDVRSAGSILANRTDLVLYVPFSYWKTLTAPQPAVMVRSSRPLGEVHERVLAHASALDPSLPVGDPVPLSVVMERQLADRRAFAAVLTLLGGLGFLLSAVGLYGLLAQMVVERTREFGIRMAIGADARRIIVVVLKQAMWIAALGSAAGLALAAFGSQVVEAQLFGLSRLEPWVYLASAAGLIAVVLIAALWPARAAVRIQPVEALRTD
jgi:putative ABC transport system permease protein